MKLFGQLVRTAVNVAALPVRLPVAAVKDVADYACGDRPKATSRLIEQLKRDAEEE